MSGSENQNIRQEDDIQLFAAFEKPEEFGEFYRQQAEFWAAECISEQNKTQVSMVVMMIVCFISAASFAMNMLQCQ